MTQKDVETFLAVALKALHVAEAALLEARQTAVPQCPPTPTPTWALAHDAQIDCGRDGDLQMRITGSVRYLSWGNTAPNLAQHLHYQPRAVVRAERRIRAAAQWHLDRIAGLQRHCAYEQALHANECREIEAAAVATALGTTP